MPAETWKKLPRYSGVLQTGNHDVGKRKKLGRILLWENDSANPKAPKFFGTIHTSYGKALVSLWEFAPGRRNRKELSEVCK